MSSEASSEASGGVPPVSEAHGLPSETPFSASNDALRLSAFDPLGREIHTWVLPIDPEAGRNLDTAVKGSSQVPLPTPADEPTLTLTQGTLSLHIDLASGQLAALSRGERDFSLSAGPRPVKGELARLLEHRSWTEDGSQIFEAQYQGGLDTLRWQLFPSGWVRLDYAYSVQGEQELFGVGFSYPEEKVEHLLRFGEGPARVWKNRLAGGRLGLWQQSPNEGRTGEIWTYPEWQGFFAATRWLDLHTTEGRLTIVLGPDKPYLGVGQIRFPAKPRGATTIVPETDLSFLHGIPGIGSKFHSADELGPAGEPYRDPGPQSGTLWLYLHPAELNAEDAASVP
jgi:hypothetical protein